MVPACERFDRLRRRLSCFIGDARGGRRSVGELAGRLGRLGEVAIVGGMLRDLLLRDDYASFRSDVDLVVDAPDTPEVRALLREYGAVENRFGGWALSTAWRADVWLLSRTWARVQGHRAVAKVDDLLETTFFNWDAVIYSLSRKRVICRDGYLADLDSRFLDINLEPNPNRVGSCVRTLRSAVLWGAVVSPRLARFALGVIGEVGASSLLIAEGRSFGHRRVLTKATIDEAVGAFASAVATGMPSPPLRAAHRGVQRQLPLPPPAPATAPSSRKPDGTGASRPSRTSAPRPGRHSGILALPLHAVTAPEQVAGAHR